MEGDKRREKLLQWHPAFFAGLQIELKEDADNLIFENEHQLGTKPMGIDILIIKKEADRPVRKNIGQIFRKYNILEYKAPGDYLSIDDFYKVYGYACFYKADTGKMDAIPVEELTISFVSESYPRKMIRYLEEKLCYEVRERTPGIYDIMGNHITMQIIITRQLPKQTNLWIRSLTNRLDDLASAEELARVYQAHKNEQLYQSVMEIIMRANSKKFREASGMCEALVELMEEVMGDRMREELAIKLEEQEKELEKKLEKKYEKEFKARKLEQEKEFKVRKLEQEKELERKLQRKNILILKLSEQGRVEELIKTASDPEYEKKLLEEFGI